jgi:hypothetical protein
MSAPEIINLEAYEALEPYSGEVYEYREFRVNTEVTEDHQAKFKRSLDALGAQGWILLSVSPPMKEVTGIKTTNGEEMFRVYFVILCSRKMLK